MMNTCVSLFLQLILQLTLLGTSLYAEGVPSLCSQCLASAKEEFDKCRDAAISREDKNSCEGKKDARAKACQGGECKIERAAQSGNRDMPQPRSPAAP